MQFIKSLERCYSIRLSDLQSLKSKIHFVTASLNNQNSCFNRSCICLDFVNEFSELKSKNVENTARDKTEWEEEIMSLHEFPE